MEYIYQLPEWLILLLISSRSLAFALTSLLLAFGASSFALNKHAFADDDLWYPGEGVKQDMYVKYKIQELDTANGDEFVMTMWFKEKQDGTWIVPTAVQHGYDIFTGTLKLTDGMFPLAGDDQVPPEMEDFISGYKGSLFWLDCCTSKAEPKSLNSPSWGRTGNIGGSDVKPSGKETVNVTAGTYETTVLVVHKGFDSKIWIRNEFPFPVKAEFFTDTTEGTPQTQFKFELLDTGTGEPEALIPPGPLKSPVERRTHSGYYIILTWTPEEIRPNSNVSLGFEMYDKQKFPLLDVGYDLTVKDSKGNILEELPEQKAELGAATHQIRFNGTGTMIVTVTINDINGQTTGQFVERADFGLAAVPEFPTSAAIVAAAVIGLVIIITRGKGISFLRLFGKKGASP